jgi:hypothetical protein
MLAQILRHIPDLPTYYMGGDPESERQVKEMGIEVRV